MSRRIGAGASNAILPMIAVSTSTPRATIATGPGADSESTSRRKRERSGSPASIAQPCTERVRNDAPPSAASARGDRPQTHDVTQRQPRVVPHRSPPLFALTTMLSGRFEVELPIVKQGEFELAADLGWVRHIQEELNSAVPMGPTPIFR